MIFLDDESEVVVHPFIVLANYMTTSTRHLSDQAAALPPLSVLLCAVTS